MEYNLQAIGERIRMERKSILNGKRMGISQGELAERLNYSKDYRQIVAKWESGAELPTLRDALKLCAIFDCELGYLLCEPTYTCKDARKTDIQKETQLSETAINTLLGICKYGPTATHKALNIILENEKMWQFFIEDRPITDQIEGINLLWHIGRYLSDDRAESHYLVYIDKKEGYPNNRVEISVNNYINHGEPLAALYDRAILDTINDGLKEMRKEDTKTATKPTPAP